MPVPIVNQTKHVFVGGGRHAAEIQQIAGEVGYGVEQGRFHIVVPQDDGIAFCSELIDFISQSGLDFEFTARDDIMQFNLQFL